MDQSETNLDFTSPTAGASSSALQEEVQSLRTIVVGVLLLVIALTGVLDIFLFRQASLQKAQVADLQKVVDNFNSVEVPAARDAWNKIVEYSKTHPDLVPIIEKYKQFLVQSPAPTPVAAPKK